MFKVHTYICNRLCRIIYMHHIVRFRSFTSTKKRWTGLFLHRNTVNLLSTTLTLKMVDVWVCMNLHICGCLQNRCRDRHTHKMKKGIPQCYRKDSEETTDVSLWIKDLNLSLLYVWACADHYKGLSVNTNVHSSTGCFAYNAGEESIAKELRSQCASS